MEFKKKLMKIGNSAGFTLSKTEREAYDFRIGKFYKIRINTDKYYFNASKKLDKQIRKGTEVN